jgi:GDP-L-fucose synthase
MHFLDNKNILVAGATGLVGTHALLRLKNFPRVKVRAIEHVRKPAVLAENISYQKADLSQAEDCRKIMEGIDYVLMFAGDISRRSKDFSCLTKNIIMYSRLLAAAHQAQVKKILWLGSATAYPASDSPLKEEEMFVADPPEVYFALGWMYRYLDVLGRQYAATLNPSTAICLRCTAIYGEYGDFNLSTCHVLPALIRKVVERQNPLEIWGRGETKRDFVFADDVVDGCFLALEKIEGFSALNIGLGKSYSVREILEMILDADDYREARVTYDLSKAINLPSISVDCHKAKELLGFQAKTSLKEGIRKTLKWYKTNLKMQGEKLNV